MKHYRMTIQILSPVHIGSGQDIDPLEYQVKNGIFYRLNLPAFLRQMTPAQRTEFNRRVSDPNPAVLRDFLYRQVDPEKYSCFKADAGGFDAMYQKNLKNPNTKLQITLMTRSPGTWQAYLPGSSIKGAIRTAVLSELAKQNTKLRKPVNPKFFEKEVLGCSDPRTDPFRCLKIADAMLPDAATFIDKTEIFKLKKEAGPDPSGIQMFYEQCFSMLDGETIEARGTLELDDLLPQKTYFDKKEQQNKNAVSMPLTISQLSTSCKAFYLPKMQEEHHTFYRSNSELEIHSQKLLAMTYKDNEFPIRLGRFSHVECTTVDEFRQPHNNKGWGKTRTLSGGIMPMGWAKVRLDEVK
jgi:CRISPR-associated protein Csm5